MANPPFYDFEVNGLYYNIISEYDKTVELKSCFNGYYSGDIVIPKTIKVNNETYAVVSVGASAFYGCEDLTSVVIPEGIKGIGIYSFFLCI